MSERERGSTTPERRPSARQRQDTPSGAAAAARVRQPERDSSDHEREDDEVEMEAADQVGGHADVQWHRKNGKHALVQIGETLSLEEDGKTFTYTRTGYRTWKCDVVGCGKVMGIKLIKDDDGTEREVPNIHGLGRRILLQHATVVKILRPPSA